MIDWDPTRPKWEQVAEVLRSKIRSGELKSGDRVPSVVSLTREFGISHVTAQKVLVALREEGLTKTTPGMGSFVK
ncbi:GntR family transcriptional regulator [Streptomyces sp. NPDC057386]|uniref:GntR family transcriptional regulator n=1 Tax=Streptomyces thermocoprophilus TaxID=78356 RepID=A0ABV5VKP5_9ACTN